MPKLGSWLPPIVAALVMVGTSAAQVVRETVDVELVLAADISQSLDRDEQMLQRTGYVAAFRSKDVIDAITSGPHKRIAVTYMEFGGDASPLQTIPWTILDSEAAAAAFADRLAAKPIYGVQQTSISAALHEAGRWIDSNSIISERQIINVSGDGANAVGAPLEPVRDELVRSGFVINGFPLMLDKPREFYDIEKLDRYFERCVIGGNAAFVAPVTRIEHVALALRKSILPANTASSAQPASPAASEVDCLAGEKAWEAGQRTRN